MSDDLSAKLDALSKKVDQQAGFTRMVVVVCTTVLVAANCYAIIEYVIPTIPKLVVAEYMASMEQIVPAWNMISAKCCATKDDKKADMTDGAAKTDAPKAK